MVVLAPPTRMLLKSTVSTSSSPGLNSSSAERNTRISTGIRARQKIGDFVHIVQVQGVSYRLSQSEFLPFTIYYHVADGEVGPGIAGGLDRKRRGAPPGWQRRNPLLAHPIDLWHYCPWKKPGRRNWPAGNGFCPPPP